MDTRLRHWMIGGCCWETGPVGVPAGIMKLAVTNVPPEHADRIARALVEARVVACVNLLPCRSLYRWKDKVCDESEVTILMKVSDDGIERLRTVLLGLHPYELPEFIVLPVETAGSLGAYLDWVDDGCRPSVTASALASKEADP